MARALGWQFFSKDQAPITCWTELSRLTSVRPPESVRLFEDLIVAVDVRNPLLGPAGCSRVYGPQKGLKEFELAERCLGQLATVLHEQLGLAHATTAGAGAAGGLGFGLLSFLGGRVESGLEIFARYARLIERVNSAQLVITGEGTLDAQSLMGKGVGELARLCQQRGVACLGLAGRLPEPEKVKTEFQASYALTPGLTSQENALRQPEWWLERLAAKVAQHWPDGPQ